MEKGARTQLGRDPMKIEVDPVMAGAVVIHADDEQILLGFPEEVSKACFASGKQITGWLLPDVRSHQGVAQWALEFPLYVALFVQGLFAKGKKLTVFCHERDWKDAVEYLRLTLLGLTLKEMEEIGVKKETAAFLTKEAEYLALKRADGTVAQIDDFLHPVFFDKDGKARFGGLTLERHGHNTYSFFTEEHRVERFELKVEGDQLPPYTCAITQATTPILPQQLELVTLGASNGFDIAGPCSNMVVQIAGHFLLLDSGPYIQKVLESSGISLNQIEAMVLTHAHEDHAVGVSALLQLGRRLKLYTSRETAEIVRRKLAILNPEVDRPRTLLDEAFDLIYVEPGKSYDFLGLSMRFHYTMHSIPCVGVELSCDDLGVTRRILVTGDNNSRPAIEKAAQEGVLAPERARDLLELYERQCDLVVTDAGGGLIHGVTADFEANPSTNIVYVHTGKLPDEAAHLFTLAAPGFRYTVVPENSRPTPLERDCAFRALTHSFETTREEWIGTLLDSATPLSVNRGQVVVRQNDRTADFFAVLSGKLEVLVQGEGEKPHRVAEIHPGEVFGEMAVIMGAPRNATVRAITPVRLLRVPGEAFRRFAAQENVAGQLMHLWQKRANIQSVDILAALPVSTLNALAKVARKEEVEVGARLIAEGENADEVYILTEGRLQVFKAGSPLIVNGAPVVLHPGQIVGEAAPFREVPRSASVVALERCTVLAISGADFVRLTRQVPKLHYHISMMVKTRAAS